MYTNKCKSYTPNYLSPYLCCPTALYFKCQKSIPLAAGSWSYGDR